MSRSCGSSTKKSVRSASPTSTTGKRPSRAQAPGGPSTRFSALQSPTQPARTGATREYNSRSARCVRGPFRRSPNVLTSSMHTTTTAGRPYASTVPRAPSPFSSVRNANANAPGSRDDFYTALWNYLDCTAAVFPVTHADRARDAPAPAHAFRNHEDEAVYRMCESCPPPPASTFEHVFPVRAPHPPRVPGRRALCRDQVEPGPPTIGGEAGK